MFSGIANAHKINHRIRGSIDEFHCSRPIFTLTKPCSRYAQPLLLFKCAFSGARFFEIHHPRFAFDFESLDAFCAIGIRSMPK
jgi:hypothetical protein